MSDNREMEIVVKGNPFVRKEIKPKEEKVKPAKLEIIETEEYGNFITAKRAQEILGSNNTTLVYKAAKDGKIQYTDPINGLVYYSENDIIAWAEQRKLESELHPRKPRLPNKPKTLISETLPSIETNGNGHESELTVEDLVAA